MTTETAPTTTTTTCTANTGEQAPVDTMIRELLVAATTTTDDASSSSHHHQDRIQNVLNEYSSISVREWMSTLVSKLFDETHAESTLAVLTHLLPMDATHYPPRLAEALVHHVHNNHTTLYVSPKVLQLWMHQMIWTSEVAVHTRLSQAFLSLVLKQPPDQQRRLCQLSLRQLTTLWKTQLVTMKDRSSSSSSSEASVVAVRCATIWMECLVVLGDDVLDNNDDNDGDSNNNASTLLLQMMEMVSDPLLQLSILDLISQSLPRFNTTSSEDGTVVETRRIRAWLVSDAMTRPILALLDDPLLSGAAMNYLSLAVKVMDTTTTASSSTTTTTTTLERICHPLFHHIRTMGPNTTNELDRLAIITALSQMAHTFYGLQSILQDDALRQAWVGDLTRVPPSLQAAILMSVAQVLSFIVQQEDDDDNTNKTTMIQLGLQLYNQLVHDNTATAYTTTTDWLWNKYAKAPPLPEGRLATYALWSAVAALPMGVATLTNNNNDDEWLIWLLEHYESTLETRIAKYQVLQTLLVASQSTNVGGGGGGGWSEDLQERLQAVIDLGPHGRKAMRWDVALE